MNMRERGLIGSRPLLFVVKVKRPRFGDALRSTLDLGGGKAVTAGLAWRGQEWRSWLGTARRGTARSGTVRRSWLGVTG
jgi:hypothetical protein